MADVFLCHSSADTDDVADLGKRLQAEGVTVWLDKFNLVPGERFTSKIEEALDACTAAAVFIGKTGRSPYQNEEFEYALNTRGRRDERIIPVLLPGAKPEMIKGFLASRTRVEFKNSLDEEEPFRLLICGIRGLQPEEGIAASGVKGAPARNADECPYRPLAAFDVSDHEYFCGRNQLTAEAVARVEAMLDQPTRCFFIVGASGSGKSSLARAGVIWSLQAKHPTWTTVVLEPGARPHEILAERILKLNRLSVDGLTLKGHAEAYLSDTAMLQRSITGEIGNDAAKGRLVLFVDQFEEVFTVCESKQSRDAFIGNLLCAAKDPSGKTMVLACVRADFYENCARTELADALSKQQILVGPMRDEELRSAIRDPATRAGCAVEPTLIISLIRDCAQQPAPLPLLQIALEKLWQKRSQQGILTLAEYERMSFEGAIDEHAEAVYQKMLDDAEKKLCLHLLLQLAERLDDGRYTRRRVALQSLLPATDAKDQKSFERVKQVEKVLGVLAGRRARLIAIRSEADTARVEIAHEAIFHGWKRLAELLDQNSEFLLWKRRLDFAIGDWKDPKTKGSYLTGGPLSRALTWVRERPEGHSEEERRFISASARHRLLRRSMLGAGVAGLAAALTLGTVALVSTERQRGVEQVVHTASELLDSNNPSNMAVAALLAYHALKQEHSARTREVLQRALQAGRPLVEMDRIAGIGMSSDGATLVAAAGRAVQVWNPPPDGALRWSPRTVPNPVTLDFPGEVSTVAINADAKRIAAGDEMGTVMIWRGANAESGNPIKLGSKITALAFSGDGHLAIAAAGRQMMWWNSGQDKEEKRVPLADEARGLAVAPDGLTVAAGTGDGFVRFWKPGETSWTGDLQHKEATVTYAAWTSDAKHLGTGTKSGNAYFWDPANPKHPVTLTAPDGSAISVAMDGRGRRMASLTNTGSITVFDVASASVELHFAGQHSEIFSIAMDSEGTLLAAAAPNGVRMYELTDDRLAARARTMIRYSGLSSDDCARYLTRKVCEEDLREAGK